MHVIYKYIHIHADGKFRRRTHGRCAHGQCAHGWLMAGVLMYGMLTDSALIDSTLTRYNQAGLLKVYTQ